MYQYFNDYYASSSTSTSTTTTTMTTTTTPPPMIYDSTYSLCHIILVGTIALLVFGIFLKQMYPCFRRDCMGYNTKGDEEAMVPTTYPQFKQFPGQKSGAVLTDMTTVNETAAESSGGEVKKTASNYNRNKIIEYCLQVSSTKNTMTEHSKKTPPPPPPPLTSSSCSSSSAATPAPTTPATTTSSSSQQQRKVPSGRSPNSKISTFERDRQGLVLSDSHPLLAEKQHDNNNNNNNRGNDDKSKEFATDLVRSRLNATSTPTDTQPPFDITSSTPQDTNI